MVVFFGCYGFISGTIWKAVQETACLPLRIPSQLLQTVHKRDLRILAGIKVKLISVYVFNTLMPASAFLQLGQTFHVIHHASRGETTAACHEGSAGPWLFDIGSLLLSWQFFSFLIGQRVVHVREL